MNLEGQCVVVTGAGRGIGRATALAFAAEGARVFAVARTESNLDDLHEEADDLPGAITPFPADVTDAGKAHLLFEAIRKWVERLDVVVSAAGITTHGPTEEFSVEEWRRTLEVNLTGSFLFAREAIRLMRPAGRGLIVNVSSIAGLRAFPQSAAYCASKWGVRGLSLSLSEELRGTGIKVTSLCPGATDTPLWNDMPLSPDPSRMMRPEDLAVVIVGLAKQPPSVVTDELVVLPPDGVL